MIIYDQFETEPIVSYTGSYASNFFLERTGLYATTGNLARQLVGDRATKNLFIKNLSGKKAAYSKILDLVSGSGVPQGQRFLTLFNPTEQYQDSILGHPINYVNANGITNFPIDNSNHGYIEPEAQMLGFPTLPGSSSTALFLGTSNATITMSYVAGNCCDTKWLYAFPFEKTYRNIAKIKTPSLTTPYPIKTTLTGILGPGSGVSTTTGSFRSVLSIIFVSQSTPSGTAASSNPLPTQVEQWLDEPIGLSGSATDALTGVQEMRIGLLDKQQRFTAELMNKIFFGFGDRRNLWPEAILHGNVGSTLSCLGPQVRGWKYGILSGLPMNSKAVYRLSKFGNVRDMLEQRKYSKFYSFEESRTLEAVIIISFISGTTAYTTASNYLLNTNDSGQWDKEYKSGRPFNDSF